MFHRCWLLALVAVAPAAANLGPLPFEKGYGAAVVLKFDKALPDHTLFVVGIEPLGTKFQKVKLEPNGPTTVDTLSRAGGTLYAVPNKMAATFKTEAELAAALAKKELPAGASKFTIEPRALGALTNPVVVVSETDGVLKFAPEPPPAKGDEEKEPEPTTEARPAPRLLAVGLCAALAVGFAGAWVARRK